MEIYGWFMPRLYLIIKAGTLQPAGTGKHDDTIQIAYLDYRLARL